MENHTGQHGHGHGHKKKFRFGELEKIVSASTATATTVVLIVLWAWGKFDSTQEQSMKIVNEAKAELRNEFNQSNMARDATHQQVTTLLLDRLNSIDRKMDIIITNDRSLQK